jgi:tetratricopeptide (TPR) repeat protein
MRLLARLGIERDALDDAQLLLEGVLDVAPDYAAARFEYAQVLSKRQMHQQAQEQVGQLLAAEPANRNYRTLHAMTCIGLGQNERAVELYRDLLADAPRPAELHLSIAHSLKTLGQRDAAIAEYRKAASVRAGYGEAYWSLANLKTYRFEAAELAQMRTQLARTDLSAEDRYHFHFALGKALEDQAQYETSFQHYREGNALRRAQVHYDPARIRAHVLRAKALFTEEFFAARTGAGSAATAPIFIVGLPRSGSTLIEQILASHSQVEGTMELPDVPALAQTVGDRAGDEALRYPQALASLPPAELRALGEDYLARTRIQRKTDKPRFIDKLPNNFLHAGFIHLMLPNARIIDARRHPLGCCFSAFKQHFARGQNFTYDLGELATYYRSYVELMAHFDRVLPGRVHRVLYERMVEDTEAEVRALLAYCGLPFEEACLRFYENERAVRTASSEQVRSPIYREGMEQWRHFEPWLGPLKESLGAVLEAYPRVPDFADNHHHD